MSVQEFRHKNWDDVTGTVISSSLEKTNKTIYVSDGIRSRKEVYVYNGTVNYNYVCQGIAHSKVHNESANEEILNQFEEKYYDQERFEKSIKMAKTKHRNFGKRRKKLLPRTRKNLL